MRHPDVKRGQTLFEPIISKAISYSDRFSCPLVLTTSNPASLLVIHRMLASEILDQPIFTEEGIATGPYPWEDDNIIQLETTDEILINRLQADIAGSHLYLEEALADQERRFPGSPYLESDLTLGRLEELLLDTLAWEIQIDSRLYTVKTIDSFENSERFDMYGQCPDKFNDRYTIILTSN